MSDAYGPVTLVRVFQTVRARLAGLQHCAEVVSRMDLGPHTEFTCRKSPIAASEMVPLMYL